MERPATYGNSINKTCDRCSWTGPLKYFETIPALLSNLDKIKCPNCAKIQQRDASFQATDFELPENFRIVSGGQTGVDRGALDASMHLGIPHSGWCPRGRKAEDGVIPALYNLKEMAGSQYWKRTEQNVLDSDGTLIFPGKSKSKGTSLTIKLAKKHGKPIAVIPLDSQQAGKTMRSWLSVSRITILNIAGPRESGSPGISVATKNFLIKALSPTSNNAIYTKDLHPIHSLSERLKLYRA